MRRQDFHYELPERLIAQRPASARAASRLMRVPLVGEPRVGPFAELVDAFRGDEVLVLNDTRVVPARVHGRKPTGGAVEVFVVEPTERGVVRAMVRGKRLREGAPIELPEATAALRRRHGDGTVDLSLRIAGEPPDAAAVWAWLDRVGEVPLPPYIERAADDADRERYQTVFARAPGAVAAPTAGLHFDEPTLAALRAKGVAVHTLTLHVGPGTFRPVKADDPREHAMHSERFSVPAATAAAVRGERPVVAVGTTVVRALEAWARDPEATQTALFILPGFEFAVVDGLLTNFHLPESTLLMLVCAFAGQARVLHAYRRAVAAEMRFFSYGDAMLLRREGGSMDLKFRVEARCVDTEARLGRFRTAHNEVETPVFMPVGTLANVKALTPDELHGLGARIILGNTYHLAIRPGIDTVRALGGMHEMAAWPGSILTDSGGFQILSLAHRRKVTEAGVTFRNHVDGAELNLTPEASIEVQEAIGSDIMMVLDHLEAAEKPRTVHEAALDRTTRWAVRCLEARTRPDRALFAIVQGGIELDLRTRHVEQLAAHPFDGFAVGGLSVGESTERMYATLEHTAPRLPADRPRYLMGVGRPIDLVEGVARGVDMFDCVMPTRDARKGGLFVDGGARKINLKNARYRDERGPVDPDCACPTCARFSAGYLRHLMLAKEFLAFRLMSVHNLFVYLDLMRQVRLALRQGRFGAFRAAFASRAQA